MGGLNAEVDARYRRQTRGQHDAPKGRKTTVPTDKPYVYLGLDVGKSEHHATALDHHGKRLYNTSLPQDEKKLITLFNDLSLKRPSLAHRGPTRFHWRIISCRCPRTQYRRRVFTRSCYAKNCRSPPWQSHNRCQRRLQPWAKQPGLCPMPYGA